jgi:hypothetical protein
MILYVKDPKDYTKILLDLINTFGNIAAYKINIQKSVACLAVQGPEFNPQYQNNKEKKKNPKQ